MKARAAGARIVAEARLWLGTPYVHQAATRGAGCDCLGLLRGVWRGVLGPEPETVPAYTRDWSESAGQEVLWAAAARWLAPAGAELTEGDVLLFRMRDEAVAKHLGIAAPGVAGPAVIHAYSGHGVVESPLGPALTRRIVARFRFPEGE